MTSATCARPAHRVEQLAEPYRDLHSHTRTALHRAATSCSVLLMNGRYTAVVFNRPLHGRRLHNVRRTLLPAITVFQVGGRWRLLSETTAGLLHLLCKILSVSAPNDVQRARFPRIQNLESDFVDSACTSISPTLLWTKIRRDIKNGSTVMVKTETEKPESKDDLKSVAHAGTAKEVRFVTGRPASQAKCRNG